MPTTKIIQSIERAATILELFDDNIPELSLKEISLKSNLNKSTTFGLVNTLTALGYLVQNKDTQKYFLGPKILTLASAIKMNNVLISLTHPFLEELAQKYHETCHCAIDSGSGSVIYLDKVGSSSSSILITTKIGIKNYMHCTGIGKCLLAYKSENEIDQLFKFPLVGKTYNTITTRESLMKELTVIRKQGYAMDNEEIEIGLACVAVPVFQSKDSPGFAISVAGATPRIEDKVVHTELLKDLKSISSQLSYTIFHYSL